MRYLNHFSRRDLSLVVIFWVVLGIAVMPACSKKSGEEKKTTSQPATATESAKTMPAPPPQDPRQEKMKQLQQIQGELIAMQGETLKKYPELVKEQDDLRNLINDKIQALLKAQKVDIQQLQDIQKKLQEPNLPDNDKMALMKDFQGKAQLVKQARVEAMNDEKVKTAYIQYESHLKEKLTADHPQASEKIAAFDKIQAELQSMSSSSTAAGAGQQSPNP